MFDQRLRELRLSNGYTQATLADKIGVSEKTIRTWERGTREPSMETTVNWQIYLMSHLITFTAEIKHLLG